MAARCMYYDLYGSLKTLEVLAPEGHAHAARAAAAARRARRRHDEGPGPPWHSTSLVTVLRA